MTTNRNEISAMAAEAARRGYDAPGELMIAEYLDMCRAAAAHGIAPRRISPSRSSAGPVAYWLTAGGLLNEIHSLVARADRSGCDLRAERNEAAMAACEDCEDCADARNTGMHASMRFISHEESQCVSCGAYCFIPDVD